MHTIATQADIVRYLKVAEETARIGGEIGKKYFGRSIEVETKPNDSPVTIADKEAEVAMRHHLHALFADHRIIGEEGGASGPADSPWEWVLDPIDGTISFIHRIPLYTVLVALTYRKEPLLGVIYNPQTEELISAGNGTGCYYNGKPCFVSTVSALEKARLFFTDPVPLFRAYSTEFGDLLNSVSLARTWADGHGYMMVATGRAEIMIDPKMSYWDIACLMPIIREAGGEFTDMQGSGKLGTSAVASNGVLHKAVMDKLGIVHNAESQPQ